MLPGAGLTGYHAEVCLGPRPRRLDTVPGKTEPEWQVILKLRCELAFLIDFLYTPGDVNVLEVLQVFLQF